MIFERKENEEGEKFEHRELNLGVFFPAVIFSELQRCSSLKRLQWWL